MALDTSGTATNRIDHGETTSLIDLDPITVLMWVRPTATGVSIFADKRAGSGRGYRLLYTIGGDELRWQTDRNLGVNPIEMESAASFLTLNDWQFIGAVADSSGASGDQKLFRGDLDNEAVEPGSYTVQNVGSGTVESNSGGDQFVGNRINQDFNTEGDIGWCGIWNVGLTEGQIHDQQFRPHVTPGCVLFTHYGYNGTGTQPDWSGNGNSGAVTGATVADHVPLGPPFGLSTTMQYRIPDVLRRIFITHV